MRWVWPPERFFIERNLPKLQYVPLLLHDGDFPLEANRYVTERCLGEWAPDMDDENEDPTVLTMKSRANLATRLCAYFFWLDQDKKRDWRRLEYLDVLDYQAGLQKGTANASGRPLKESTCNQYVDEACAFLCWAAVRGLRGRFKVPKRKKRLTVASRGNHSQSHTGREVYARQGALQVPDIEPITLPEAADVERWMAALRKRHPIKALQFELMIRTGCRISEAHHMRVTCFPRKAAWKDVWFKQEWVPVLLRYGVKGPKVSTSSDLSTRCRAIQVPIDLAERIEHYLSFARPNLLARYHRGDRKGDPRSDRLWLGEKTYQPLAYSTLYDAWTQSPYCPQSWHPHSARHYFAVEQIVEAIRNFLALNNLDGKSFSAGIGWLHGLMAGQIRLILSPLLGHVDEVTSERYLRAGRARLLGNLGHPLIRWNQIIDADLEASSDG